MARMENGQWDPNYLTPLTSQGDYLVVMPASQWIGYAQRQWIASGLYDNLLAAAREFKRRTGFALVVTEAFRSLATQNEFWRRYKNGTGNTAAYPGTSNHGLGIALDLGSGIGYGGSPYQVWAEIAATYGWSNAEGLRVGERWHWTGSAKVVGSGGTPIPIEEDDMDSTQNNWLKNLYEVVFVPGPVNGGVPLANQIGGAFRDAAVARAKAEAAAVDAYAARMLSEAVFQAVFVGGSSMPDGQRSIGASLAGIVQVADQTAADTKAIAAFDEAAESSVPRLSRALGNRLTKVQTSLDSVTTKLGITTTPTNTKN